ncbi:MAG: hypothetical protein KDJ43_00550 [Rhizobiaceae bacterium]|nr:hypothetical protein [Rhizobiaceae bacterium]
MADKSHTRRQRRPLAHIAARIELSKARSYLADLQRWRAGDENRFTRMVDGRGKQLGDAGLWVEYIRQTLERADVWRYQPGVCRRIARQMQRLGY